MFLSNMNLESGGRTLLVTFNRSLLAFLNHLRPAGLVNVDARNYHWFARGYLHKHGLMGRDSIADESVRRSLILDAISHVRDNTDLPNVDKPLAFFELEIAYLQKNGIESLEDYKSVDRRGRGEPLDRAAGRPFVFAVRDQYLKARAERGYLYDNSDLASAVKKCFANDDSDRHYRHVVIDEGQDFSPEMIRSLAFAIPENGSLTFFGDVAQQIYGGDISWRSAGLNVSKAIPFARNYRNSPAIARLGLAISEMDYFKDEPDMVAPTEFAADGPPPTVVTLGSQAELIDFVVKQAREASKSGTVGILSRRNSQANSFAPYFPSAQHIDKHLSVWDPDARISYGSVHSAKGFEFDSAILVDVSDSTWPDPRAVKHDGEQAAIAADGRLLYVGVTRAKQNLTIVCVEEPTKLLPANDDLWAEVRP